MSSSSDSSESEDDQENLINKLVQDARNTCIPEKSKKLYENQYSTFLTWRNALKRKNSSEEILLAYFQEMSQKYKSSTLWSFYSRLKATIALHENIDISKYTELSNFLKRKAKNYLPKKAKTFTDEEIKTFMNTAPENEFLAHKVNKV